MFLRRPSRRASGRHRDPGDHPVAGPGLLDAQVDHDDVDLGELRQFRVVDTDPCLDHLAEYQHFAGSLRELPHRYVGGGQGDGAGFDRGDPTDGDEDASTSEQLDDQTEHPGLLADDADTDHHVADTTDGLAVGAQDHHPCEPGRVDPVHRRHGERVGVYS